MTLKPAAIALVVLVGQSFSSAPGSSDQPPLFELRRSAEALAKAEELPYIDHAGSRGDGCA